jgi:predicted Zn finger-like uncharacterized protein
VQPSREKTLVIECGKCGTRFELDSERIPDDGIRVRCSRCKHAFYLQHPERSQEVAVEAVAQKAVESATSEGANSQRFAATPNPSEDLPDENSVASGAAQLGSDHADEFGSVDDEDDWEFNEDLPSYDEPNESTAPPEQEESYELDDGDDIELDVEGLEGSDADSQAGGSIDMGYDASFTDAHAAGGLNPDTSEMGEDDLARSSMTGADATSEPQAAPALDRSDFDDSNLGNRDAPTIGESRADAFGSVEDFSSLAEPDENTPAPIAASSQGGNIEDPESWDFFGDDGDGGGSKQSALGAMQDLSQSPVTAQSGPTAAESRDMDSDLPVFDSEGASSALSRIGSALSWVAVLALIGGGVFLGVTGSFESKVSTPAFVSIGSMRAANIRGQWLETANAGTLYVVTGDLLNPEPEAASPGRAVRVNLLTEDGRVVDLAPSFAGRDLTFESIRMMSLDELEQSQWVAAHALATNEIAAGQSTRFAAAFAEAPIHASHFQLQDVELDQLSEWSAIDAEAAVVYPIAPPALGEDASAAAADVGVVVGEAGDALVSGAQAVVQAAAVESPLAN